MQGKSFPVMVRTIPIKTPAINAKAILYIPLCIIAKSNADTTIENLFPQMPRTGIIVPLKSSSSNTAGTIAAAVIVSAASRGDEKEREELAGELPEK